MFGEYSFGAPQFAEGDKEQQYVLLLSPGAYSITGSALQLVGAFLLNAAAGSYVITGADATLQLLIKNAQRIHLIASDNRTLVVPRENRTILVPREIL